MMANKVVDTDKSWAINDFVLPLTIDQVAGKVLDKVIDSGR